MNLKKIFFKKKGFLVVELGNFNLKAAFFTYPDLKPKLDRFWLEKIEGFSENEKEEKLFSLLKGNFSAPALSELEVFFVLPDTSLVIRRLSIPSIPRSEINGALKFKLKDEVFLDIEKSSYVWKIVGERVSKDGAKKLDLVVCLVLKKEVDKILNLCERLGIVCAGIYSQMFLLSGLFSSLGFQETFVVLDLGGLNANFMIFAKDAPLFLRRIPLGSNNLTCSIVSFLKDSSLSFEEAEMMKREYGLADGGNEIIKGVIPHDLLSSMRQPVEKLVSEIRKSLEYYSSEFEDIRVNKMYLLGGGGLLRNLNTLLAKELNLEVRNFSLEQVGEIGEKVTQREVLMYLPPLLGAALRDEANFLPPRSRPSGSEGMYQAIIKLGAPLLAIIFCLMFFGAILELAALKGKIKFVQTHFTAYEKVQELKREIGERSLLFNRLRQSYIPGDWIMKGLTVFMPPQIILEEIKINEGKGEVYLHGRILDYDNAEKILADYSKRMGGIEIFKEVNLVSITREDREAESILNFRMEVLLIGK